MTMKPLSSAITTSLKEVSSKTTKPHTETGVATLSTTQSQMALAKLTEAESPDKVTRLVIDSVRTLIPSIIEKHTKDYEVKSYEIGDASQEDLEKALMRVESSLVTLPLADIEQRLTALSLLIMTARDFDPEFMAIKRKALAVELAEYPADIVIAAFKSVKNTVKFWPTYAEFHEFIAWRYRPRKLLRDALRKRLDQI
jgi:hypothetical protein